MEQPNEVYLVSLGPFPMGVVKDKHLSSALKFLTAFYDTPDVSIDDVSMKVYVEDGFAGKLVFTPLPFYP